MGATFAYHVTDKDIPLCVFCGFETAQECKGVYKTQQPSLKHELCNTESAQGLPFCPSCRPPFHTAVESPIPSFCEFVYAITCTAPNICNYLFWHIFLLVYRHGSPPRRRGCQYILLHIALCLYTCTLSCPLFCPLPGASSAHPALRIRGRNAGRATQEDLPAG